MIICPNCQTENDDDNLFCDECGCWVPNTANHEMRKEGVYAYSHHCYNGVCDMSNGEIKASKETQDE